MALSDVIKGILGGGAFTKQGQNLLFGNKHQLKPFNKQGLQALLSLLQGGGLEGNDLFGAGSSFLSDLLQGTPEAFSAFEAPYLQNFEQNIVPGIAERFAGMGTGGSLASSGLNQALAQAGRNLQTDLAGLRSGLQMQALPQALGYAQQPISNIFGAAQSIPNQFYEIPGQPGALQSGLNAFAGGLGRTFGGGL